MFWDTSGYGGHTANAVAKARDEVDFRRRLPGLLRHVPADRERQRDRDDGDGDVPARERHAGREDHADRARSRARRSTPASISELIGRAFGMVVEATQPVIAERSMYFASLPNRLWTGGHVNTGVTAPSTSWFHAEGATGGFFSTFILLSNPQTTDAHVDLRFLLEDGTTIVKTKTLPAGQRLTVNPASEGEPRLENAAMSTIVAVGRADRLRAIDVLARRYHAVRRRPQQLRRRRHRHPLGPRRRPHRRRRATSRPTSCSRIRRRRPRR